MLLLSGEWSNARATSVRNVHTCTVPDISGLKAQGPAAQCETVSPLPTAAPPGFKKLLRIVVSSNNSTEKTIMYITGGKP